MACLEFINVTYRYDAGAEAALKDVCAKFESGKVYAVVGESGSGKSTLLSLASGLDTCKEGKILYDGRDLNKIDRDRYRAKSAGVIFQGFNLLQNSTAVYNIILSMDIGDSYEGSGGRREAHNGRNGRKERKEAAYALLEKVGIGREAADRKILKLSGGEQQRVGVARALSNGPGIVFADEPTGNLDSETEEAVLAILAGLAREGGKCVVIATHSDAAASVADEVFEMRAGRLLPSALC